MTTIRRPAFAVLSTLILVSGVLAGCGGHPTRSGAPPPPAATVTVAPTAPAPTASGPTAPGPTAPAPGPTTTTPAPGAARVVSARVAYAWRWPGDGSGHVTHTYRVPPLPHLTRIGAGDHPAEAGERPYNRMSFTFDTTFPNYWFAYTPTLISDARGEVIPLRGRGVLRVVFMDAQAHVSAGTRPSITSQPTRDLGYRLMVDYAQGGDFEGVVTYGIGIDWPQARANPQIPVRVYEVDRITSAGQHEYVVAIDVDAR